MLLVGNRGARAVKTGLPYSRGMSGLAIVLWLFALSFGAVLARAQALPPAPTHDRARAGTQPYYFLERDTIEASQFQLLRQSAGMPPIIAEERRAQLPAMTRIPEDQRSIEAIRNGAKRYLERWWAQHWASRRASLATGNSLYAAWHFYARDESGLFGMAKQLGFDAQELRPKAVDDETILHQLNGPVPESSNDAEEALLRGLLSRPCDQRLADATAWYVARMQEGDTTSHPAGVGNARWRLVCESPDPMLIGSVVRVVCSNRAELDAESALEAVFFAARGQRHELMTEETVFRLTKECPQDVLIRTFERAGDRLANRVPALRAVFFAPDTPHRVRIAMVGAFIDDDVALRRIFDTSQVSPDSDLIEAALRRYAGPGGLASIPRWVNVSQLVTNGVLSASARRAAVDVLQCLASSTGEKGSKAAETLEGFAADSGLPPELRQAAGGAFSASQVRRKNLEERDHKRRKAWEQDQNGEAIEESIRQIREMLSKADRSDISLSTDERTMLEFSLANQTRAVLEGSLEKLRAALGDYAGAKDDRLPPNLDALKEMTGFETRTDLRFFSVMEQPARRLPADVILAVVELPTQRGNELQDLVAALFAGGRVQPLRREGFARAWEHSNALRRSIGSPAISPSQLGKLAYLVASQTQPTQPSSAPAR
jgi:hypothetical protein